MEPKVNDLKSDETRMYNFQQSYWFSQILNINIYSISHYFFHFLEHYAVTAKYIELDHDLVPRKTKEINVEKELPTGKDIPEPSGPFKMTSKTVKKYKVHKGNFAHAFKSAERAKNQTHFKDFKAVAGTKTSDDFYFDHDWGFFSPVLGPNHLYLSTYHLLADLCQDINKACWL